jgi:hypothetical protein
MTIRGGKDGSIAFAAGITYGSDVGVISKTTDNGVTNSEVNHVAGGNSLAASPDGMTLMAADASSLQAKRSSDGGTTWGNIGIAGNYSAFVCYGASNLWVTAGVQSVKYSIDGGTTWTDITGDLLGWIPSSDLWTPIRIKAW